MPSFRAARFFYTKKVATPFGSRGFPRFPSRGGPGIGVSSNTIRHTASDTFRHCDTAPSTAGLSAGVRGTIGKG